MKRLIFTFTFTTFLVAFSYAQTWRQLNENAWKIYETSYNTNELEKALEWAKHSIELDENFYNTDTYAHLCYKLGKNKEALLWAKRSLELANEANIKETSETQSLISKINSSSLPSTMARSSNFVNMKIVKVELVSFEPMHPSGSSWDYASENYKADVYCTINNNGSKIYESGVYKDCDHSRPTIFDIGQNTLIIHKSNFGQKITISFFDDDSITQDDFISGMEFLPTNAQGQSIVSLKVKNTTINAYIVWE